MIRADLPHAYVTDACSCCHAAAYTTYSIGRDAVAAVLQEVSYWLLCQLSELAAHHTPAIDSESCGSAVAIKVGVQAAWHTSSGNA